MQTNIIEKRIHHSINAKKGGLNIKIIINLKIVYYEGKGWLGSVDEVKGGIRYILFNNLLLIRYFLTYTNS